MAEHDEREPAGGDRSRRDDDVHDLPTPEPDAAASEAGRDALRELGDPGPVPADVLARLEGRLEGELGRDAPARRARPRRRRRLVLLAPGFGVAVAAIVAVAVVSTHGSSSHPTAGGTFASRSTERALAPAKVAPQAAAGAADSALPALVPVPAVVGRPYGQARRLLERKGFVVGDGCSASERVTAQRPKAGTRAARGSRVVIRTRRCIVFTSP
jgi:hypothetical protein